jgi:hypothetical protein
MKARFEGLVSEFCALCAIADPSHVINGGAVSINGVLILLRHKEQVDPTRLFVHCDFGEIPVTRQTDIYQALLEANLDLYDGGGPLFSVSPRSGRALFSHSYLMDELTAAQLHGALIALAESGRDWRATHFLASPRARRSFPVARSVIGHGGAGGISK